MALTTTDSEMMLLARLPDDDRVLILQTPRLRTVADLEDFIVDEYARVYPHMPQLSRDLRIQKCVSPELVVDPRAPKRTPLCFADMTKNVQVGKVFKDMEQIYIVFNQNGKTQPKQLQRKQPSVKKIAAAPLTASPKNGVETQKTGTKEKKKSAIKDNHEGKETTAKANHASKKENKKDVTKNSKKKETAPKGTQEGKKKDVSKPNHEISKKDAKDEQDKKKKDAGSAANDKNDGKKKESAKDNSSNNNDKKNAAKETHESGKKITAKEKKKASAKENQETKKKTAAKDPSKKAVTEGKDDAKVEIAGKNHDSKKEQLPSDLAVDETVTVLKKAPKKSGNALLKQMNELRAAKHAESGASLVAQMLATADTTTSGQTVGKTRKASEEHDDANREQPPAKKVKPETKEPSNSSQESTSKATTARKKKKMDAAGETPAAKRAKTEAAAKGESTKKGETTTSTTDKEDSSATAMVTSADVETSSNSSSTTSSTSSSLTESIGEQAKRQARKLKLKANRFNMSADPAVSSTVGGFQQILKDSRTRIDAEIEAEAERVAEMAAKQEKEFKKTPKSSEDTASESSGSDTEGPTTPVVASRKETPAPANDDSSSSSDEEELDYSQSLLADLTRNDTDDESAKPSQKHKSDDVVVVETSQGSDMPSSELTQKSQQELTSVMLSTMSRNPFSLDSMPVAKLKKSSKNPFSSKKPSASPKKTKAKTSTNRPRGRPRKVKE